MSYALHCPLAEEFWALRSSGAFDDDKDHVVQLQQTCADNSCEPLLQQH